MSSNHISALIGLVAVLSTQTYLRASELSFETGIDHPTGRGSQSIAICDLNRDGVVDIVTANSLDHTVSVLLLRRNASLIGREDWPVSPGGSPTSVLCADINRDGRLDVLTSSRRDTVSVLLGDGLGHLSNATHYPTGRSSPVSIVTADLDRNGRLDVITANSVGSVSVLFGSGDGMLGPFRQYPVDGINPAVGRVHTEDLNLNGKPEVITANGFANTISVLQTKWDGELRPRVDYATPRFPRALATGDVNHDGRIDIVVGSAVAFSVFLGRSDWFLMTHFADYATENIRGIALADLDFDGNLDIAIADQMLNDALGVFPGKGDGTFKEKIGFEGGYFPYDLAVADLNRDSRPDVITVQENFVRILLNDTPRYDWERTAN